MAKNKKERKQPKESQSERGQQQSEKATLDAISHSQAQGSPADVARKHQRRFGHN
ncbi:hypothetical protein ACH4YO_11940 [Streptomyces noursei]|uniref:Small hydrophilic protein n=1 Tax=Streptomyces yunnanensis TaxID=156453 RepID=A0ABY8ADU6_9ACTN|nr:MULTISPECIES: hypothetical protein [Streptomyces]AJC59028.1 hypothetical protein GZL_06458 [Streptomyces sp. 769]WEB43093.1 hypothetical protein MOV08_30070 [Streptomyces yunnanensis]